MGARGRKLGPGRTESYVGQRKSGKTWELFKKLTLAYFQSGKVKKPSTEKKLPYFIMIQPSYEGNTAYEKFPHIKKLFTGKHGTHFTSYDKQISWEVQKLITRAIRVGRRPFVIIDDVGGDTYLKRGSSNSNLVTYLAKQASHYPIVLICLFQRFVQAPVILRNQADAVHLFATSNMEELTLYKKTYWGLKDKETFLKDWNMVFQEPFDHLTVTMEAGGLKKFWKNGKPVQFDR